MKKIITYLCLLVSICMMDACRKKDEVVQLPLAVTSYYPNSGNAGTLVTILGTGFPKDGKVTFGDAVATVLNQNDTTLVVRAPEDGQTGKLTLVTTDKTVDIGEYTYQELSVHSFTPANGAIGSQIRISGTGFGNASSPAEVTINGVPATVVSVSDTLIVAVIPKNASSGPVVVKVNGQSSTGANFQFQDIGSIKPMTGGVGTKVTINGSGFSTVTIGNVVEFNGKVAQILEASETKLLVVAPDGVTTGPIAVAVNGQKMAGPTFTIVPFPAINVVTPLSGPAGLEMSISGLNFSTIADENVVKINGTVVAVKTATANKLTLTLPGGTGNGKIVVAVNDQQVEGPEFRDQNLGITKVAPANGLAGTRVTITGAGFSTVAGENTVLFNGVAATIQSATETELVVVTPAALTTGDLVVRRAALEAKAAEEFRRAGVQTLFGGPGTGSGIDYATPALTVDASGNVYIGSRSNPTIRKITPAGVITTYAGKDNTFGSADGTLADATFSGIFGLDIDASGNMFVGDKGGTNSVRKITPGGVVSTYKSGINSIARVFTDKAGLVYATQLYAGIVKIYATGATEQMLRTTASDNCKPAIDAAGNIYFLSDDYATYVSKVTPGSTPNIYFLGSDTYGYQDGPGSKAMFSSIKGLAMDADGNLIIMDGFNYALRKYNFATGEVSTVMKLTNGFADGSFEEAKISGSVTDMAIGKDGAIYLLDTGNGAVRKIFLR